MTRFQRVLVPMVVLMLGAAMAATAHAQTSSGSRRGFSGRGSLLGLLRIEQVQKELKLGEQDIAKITEIGSKIREEAREQYTALREIEDAQQRRAKYTELADQSDRKAREQLRDVLSREQMMRLYQIRMQVRSAVDSLANRYVARRLELTEDQQKKLAEVSKAAQDSRSGLFASFRDASEQQRREAYEKYRKIRSEADEKALGVLTAEQKKAFEEMKGKKIELPSRRGR